MDQKSRRSLVARAFREQKVALRKGHWTIPGEEVTWWIDLRSRTPAPDAVLGFEIGAWTPGAGPKPEGGAIDCPLLADEVLGEDPAAQTGALVARLRAISTVADLRSADLPQVHLDAAFRSLLGR